MYVPGEKNIVGESTRSGRTTLQNAQLVEGSPEKAQADKQARSLTLMEMKKWLYKFEHEPLTRAYHVQEEALQKRIWAIDSEDTLKRMLISHGFQPFIPKVEKTGEGRSV
ncbi:unnamed protein product [marine sediment metagenome]|uniref:Uncharacterized protein n=1 Tax=marine sediment metagenome TaxID=412755 RepID=X1KM37_9ZZZZ